MTESAGSFFPYAREVVVKVIQPVQNLLHEKQSKAGAYKAFREVARANYVTHSLDPDNKDPINLSNYRPGTVFSVYYPHKWNHPAQNDEPPYHIEWYVLGNTINNHPTVYIVKFTSFEGEKAKKDGKLRDEKVTLEKLDTNLPPAGFQVKDAHRYLLDQEKIDTFWPNCRTQNITFVKPEHSRNHPGNPPSKSRIPELETPPGQFVPGLVTIPINK